MVMSILVLTPPKAAFAEGGCSSLGSFFDGYAANGGYNGATYRGVVGNLITRNGNPCDKNAYPWTDPTVNFTMAWYMIAGPVVYGHCGAFFTGGYSQAGYIHGTGQAIFSFAETNPDGCGPPRRVLWAPENVNDVHRYAETWFPWANVMASQLDGQVGTSDQAMLYTDFDPVAWWGYYHNSYSTDGWEPQIYGEARDQQSDMPGNYGSSALFYAMGSEPDGYGWIGSIGLNTPTNGPPTGNLNRWALSGINAYNPNVYGLNFEIYTK